MAIPTAVISDSLLLRKKPFIGVVFRLSIAAIVVLIALGMFWAAVSFHEPDSASTAGWLMAPVVWLLSSAYHKWKAIPIADKGAPELKIARLASGIALGVLLATITGTTLSIAIPLGQRHERSQRIRRLLDEAKALEPASTKNRLEIRSIMNQDVQNFAAFHIQCTDLQSALDENDVLVTKRQELLGQLSYEYRGYTDALSLVTLFKQITAEDAKASAVLRDLIACSTTLEKLDETHKRKFPQLCKASALQQLQVFQPTMENLLRQAQQGGAKLPPDVLDALR